MTARPTLDDRQILFKGEMVRRILADEKTQTRRPVKGPPSWAEEFGHTCFTPAGHISVRGPVGDNRGEKFIRCPYGQPGNQLWVREAWKYSGTCSKSDGSGGWVTTASVTYRADDVRRAGIDVNALWPDGLPQQNAPAGLSEVDHEAWLLKWWRKWRPSIHMPRWASRINLDVTGVRVERLQSITEDDILDEGVTEDRLLTEDERRAQFARLWDSINAKRAPWEKNPWVWVITFRRVR